MRSIHQSALRAPLTIVTVLLTACAGEPSSAPSRLAPPEALLTVYRSDADSYALILADGGITWADAMVDAASRGGHLVAITSQAENDLLVSLFDAELNGFVWIGASDLAAEGTWRWIGGPEAGSQIHQLGQ